MQSAANLGQKKKKIKPRKKQHFYQILLERSLNVEMICTPMVFCPPLV